jgi:hypothetical protein
VLDDYGFEGHDAQWRGMAELGFQVVALWTAKELVTKARLRCTRRRGRGSRRVKILFCMYQPGFVRHFTRTIGLLCEEGHTIHIAFHHQKVDAQEWTQELRSSHPEVTISINAPRRADVWTELCLYTRAMRDYVMYFDPRYAQAGRLREHAIRETEDSARAIVERVVSIPGLRHVFDRLLHAVERAIPSDPQIEAFIAGHAPDLILVTPLVMFNSPQVDFVKSARKLGIPCALCVASWDNLTNKGRMRELPDRVMVWNEAQVEEAVTLHGMPRDRIIVTGAQSFDHWFEFQPSRTRAAFLAECGLEPDSDLILYLCSSTSIAPDEAEFIGQWHDAVRAARDPRVARAAILVRPHPVNRQPWERLDARALPNFAVWPRDSIGPFNPQERRDYFDAIHHADVVVGLNTSGQVEAGLIGKPVLTLLSHDIPNTLRGTMDTLHFQHLLQVNGGLLHVAKSFEEHLQQLSRAISRDPDMLERSRRFTESFIRPHGMEKPAAPILADAIRSVGTVVPRRPLLDRLLLDKVVRRLLKRIVHRMKMRKRQKKKAAAQRE